MDIVRTVETIPLRIGDRKERVEVTTIHVGDGIAFVRLLSLRGMVKLEKVGLKTRGGAIRPRIAAEFGLKPRDSHDVFIAKLDELIAAAKARRAAELS